MTTDTQIDKAVELDRAADAVITDALRAGDTKAAVTEAMHRLRSALAAARHPRHGRPGDGQHLDAELAGTLMVLAEQASLHEAPAGFPAKPGGYQLLGVYQAARTAAITAPPTGEEG